MAEPVLLISTIMQLIKKYIIIYLIYSLRNAILLKIIKVLRSR